MSDQMALSVLLDGNGGITSCPELLTEEELIRFLRIPEISKANNYSNVIANLKRMHDPDKNRDCDWTKAVMKYMVKPQEDLKFLMEDRIKDYAERYEKWTEIESQNKEADQSESSSVRAKL